MHKALPNRYDNKLLDVMCPAKVKDSNGKKRNNHYFSLKLMQKYRSQLSNKIKIGHWFQTAAENIEVNCFPLKSQMFSFKLQFRNVSVKTDHGIPIRQLSIL